MQKMVEDFILKNDLKTDVPTRYIDLVSEIGELGKEILMSTDYGKKSFTTSAPMTDEVGDCLFSFLALCHELGINAQDALYNSLEKYERRLEKKGDISSDEKELPNDF